ncbi:hypothetical protein [Virgibacillus sp. Bac332]|uniref:hypothetical protein n=1 Tax=Virgibacillus sp. Bac332 TaxID=2419842 RepID=UPI001F08A3F2|nr:hypothetical protein [Virgibacillus sp. Bac332]
MSNLNGIQMKYIVVKNEDIEKYLNKSDKQLFTNCVGQIQMSREIEGRDNPTYLVINTDELYADEVIDIMKKHGHWGMKGESE